MRTYQSHQAQFYGLYVQVLSEARTNGLARKTLTALGFGLEEGNQRVGHMQNLPCIWARYCVRKRSQPFTESESKYAVDGNHTERIWQRHLLCPALLASSRAFADVFKELAIAAEVLRRLAESYVSKSSPEEAQNALGSALSSMGYEANEFPRDVSNSPVDSTWGEIYLRISSSIHLLSTTKASRHLLTMMISPGHICATLIVTSISSQI
jgi:hypothetical protein